MHTAMQYKHVPVAIKFVQRVAGAPFCCSSHIIQLELYPIPRLTGDNAVASRHCGVPVATLPVVIFEHAPLKPVSVYQ